ncbi:MAG: hypothetical protein GEU99_02940 [Luteitalea sp.]|nr:hypothetical protein [Luteitalea sp.]
MPTSRPLPSRLEASPRWIVGSTTVLLALGAAASVAWWQTGDPAWIQSYFHYPGTLFFIACSALGAALSGLVWRHFSRGELLRPAWFLIFLSALCQLVGALAGHLLGRPSLMNPLVYLSANTSEILIDRALDVGRVLSPLYMALLACGLFYVLRACRRNGVLGRLKPIDVILIGIVSGYTIHFFATSVLTPMRPSEPVDVVLAWTSDPLLCVLLLEAILIHRSAANLGWGLIPRCWVAFTTAILLTSLGDMGLWAWGKGYLPYALAVVSWHVWFVASACFALGPAYQLQAILQASRGYVWREVSEAVQGFAQESAQGSI